MKRLILTTSDSSAGCLRQPGIADMVMPFGQRFSIGEQSPPDAGIDSLTMAHRRKNKPTMNGCWTSTTGTLETSIAAQV
jgi:hypothetical protein